MDRWMVDGCKNRKSGLKMDKRGSEQNWPALSVWTKHTGHLCLFLFEDIQLICRLWDSSRGNAAQSNAGHLHGFRLELWYVLTMVLCQLAGCWCPSEYVQMPTQSCKALPGHYQFCDLQINQSQVSEKIKLYTSLLNDHVFILLSPV